MEKPAHNKQYAPRRLFGGSGFEKPQSPTALCGFLSPTFQPTANLRFALLGGLERRILRTLYEMPA
jgi:hypothetical protein